MQHAKPDTIHLPSTRLQRRLQQIEKLDAQERRQILQVIDAFIERGQLKRKAQGKQAA